MPNCHCCRHHRVFVRTRRPVKRRCIRIRAFSANLPARSFARLPAQSLTVLRPPPSDDLCVLADEGLPVAGQAHRHDVLLEDHVPRQPHHRHVVPEVGRAVLGVHLGGGRRGREYLFHRRGERWLVAKSCIVYPTQSSSNGFAPSLARNGVIVISRVSPPLRSPRAGAARRAISRSTRPV